MLFQINFKSGLPVYLQLVEQIKAATASGALRVGDPLPPIRPLAEQLRVNRNTVAKAYTELEGQGVIETVAGKGCFIRENGSPFRKEIREKLLIQSIDAVLVQAHHLQVSADHFFELVQKRLKAFEQQVQQNSNSPRSEKGAL
jgi:GntR family transcriptional regulator